MYGGYPVYIGGILWFTVWSFIAGWSQNELMMDFCRALQGIGPAAYLPSGLMLLGSIYRPGPRKNLVFAIYGAMAPLGFFCGIFFAGLTAQYTTWRWYFFIGTILSLSTVIVSFFAIPSDRQERKGMDVKMDWWGAILISVGLILVVFAITDSAHAPNGWSNPYIFVLFIVGMLILAAAVYVEGWVAEQPLLPFDIFQVKYMKPLCVALLFSYGSLGFTPMALGGCIISTVGGIFLHRIPGTFIIIAAGAAWIISPLLFAVAPSGANYWAYTFPSMICATIAIDLTFTVTNVFFTTSLPLKRQGLAGALINSLVQLSIAVFLGLADVTAAETVDLGLKKSYKAVFWFEVGLACIAQILMVGFVKLKPATSDLTADEKAALKMAEEQARRNAGRATAEESEKQQRLAEGRT
ncbi:MFS transporter [Neofusicoccum parvum]|nr:MFS transporter [Neofusicoccum parvum]